MKYKALVTKTTPREYVALYNVEGIVVVVLKHTPQLLTSEMTMATIKEFYKNHSFYGVNLDDYDLIDVEVVESNSIGADIRNKLTSPLNLATMLEKYLNEPEKHKKLLPFIKKEIEQSKTAIEYIANLL